MDPWYPLFHTRNRGSIGPRCLGVAASGNHAISCIMGKRDQGLLQQTAAQAAIQAEAVSATSLPLRAFNIFEGYRRRMSVPEPPQPQSVAAPLTDPQDPVDMYSWPRENERGYRIQEQPYGTERPLRVIHIGAGISGICIAKFLPESLKNLSLTCYDKNSDIGGTWLENRCRPSNISYGIWLTRSLDIRVALVIFLR